MIANLLIMILMQSIFTDFVNFIYNFDYSNKSGNKQLQQGLRPNQMQKQNNDNEKQQEIDKPPYEVVNKRNSWNKMASKYMDREKASFDNLVQKSFKKKKILQIQQQEQQQQQQQQKPQTKDSQEMSSQRLDIAKLPSFHQGLQSLAKENIDFYNQIQKKMNESETQKQQMIEMSFSQRFNKIANYDNFIDKEIQKKQHTFSIHVIKRQNNDSRAVNVNFPYDPYQIQMNYVLELMNAIENKENALLQSPTGTGKTLCIFTGVLAWYYQSVNQIPSAQRPRIIYLSRTHSQIRQAQQELKKTCYRPSTAVLGSRDQLCIKEQYQQYKGSQKNQKCAQSRKIARKNPLTLTVQQKKKVCKYYCSNKDDIRYFEKNCKNRVMDIEELKSVCQKNNLCPYYFGKKTVQMANLIFMPYDYLLSQQLLQKNMSLITNSIIIFDEAHNVAQKACNGKDSAIRSWIFKQAINEAKAFQKVKQNGISQLFSLAQGLEVSQEIINRLKEIQSEIQSFFERQYKEENFKGALDDKATQVIREDRFVEVMHTMLMHNQKKLINADQNESYRRKELNGFLQPLIKLLGRFVEIINLASASNSNNLQKICFFFGKVLTLIKEAQEKQWSEIQANHYRIFLNRKPFKLRQFQIELKCMTPSLLFKDICMLKPRSIILTSGTLSPLSSCQKQLNLSFKWKLLNGHVINPKQLELHIVNNLTILPEKIPLNFSFASTQDYEKACRLYKCLGEKILELCRIIPGGILVVFPSYRVLINFDKQVKGKIQKEMKKYKEIFNQGQNRVGDVSEFIGNFKRSAQKKGSILFCVCRGKVSEGIDLSDQLCRGVIFIGVPYAAFKDPFVQEKKRYLDTLSKKYNQGKKEAHQYSINGNQWYQQEATRAVNQALGRVIRHKNDYGMIFLMDQRYAQAKLRQSLPGWSVQSQIVVKEMSQSIKLAERFFEQWEHSQLKGKRVSELVNLEEKRQINGLKAIMPNFKKESKRNIVFKGEAQKFQLYGGTTKNTGVFKNISEQSCNNKKKNAFEILMTGHRKKDQKKNN